MRESHTAILEREMPLRGCYATEPYEVAWAREAIFFVRAHTAAPAAAHLARVQLSPDGMHWCDEGSTVRVAHPGHELSHVKVGHFGGWLRLAGTVPDDEQLVLSVQLVLKG